MFTSGNEIIHYDGRTFTINVPQTIQIEARRSRRWGWFGPKGWWVDLSLFRHWHVKKFVLTLADAGVFLKHDPDYLPWIEEEQSRSSASNPTTSTSSASSIQSGY